MDFNSRILQPACWFGNSGSSYIHLQVAKIIKHSSRWTALFWLWKKTSFLHCLGFQQSWVSAIERYHISWTSAKDTIDAFIPFYHWAVKGQPLWKPNRNSRVASEILKSNYMIPISILILLKCAFVVSSKSFRLQFGLILDQFWFDQHGHARDNGSCSSEHLENNRLFFFWNIGHLTYIIEK